MKSSSLIHAWSIPHPGHSVVVIFIYSWPTTIKLSIEEHNSFVLASGRIEKYWSIHSITGLPYLLLFKSRSAWDLELVLTQTAGLHLKMPALESSKLVRTQTSPHIFLHKLWNSEPQLNVCQV